MNNVIVAKLEDSGNASLKYQVFVQPSIEVPKPSRRKTSKTSDGNTVKKNQRGNQDVEFKRLSTNNKMPSNATSEKEAGEENALLLSVAPGKHGFVSVGDVCTFSCGLIVVIQEIIWSEGMPQAKCGVCIATKDVWNLEHLCNLNCPTAKLITTTQRLSCSLQKVCEEWRFQAFEAVASVAVHNAHYLSDVHKYRLGHFMYNKLNAIMKSKYLRTSFQILVDERVFALFGLTKDNNFKNSFLIEQNFHYLDDFLGPFWDVRKSADIFVFIRSLSFCLKGSVIECIVCKSTSTQPYNNDTYRQIANASLYKLC